MFGLILGIAALAAFITVVVKLTLLAMSWLSNKVKEKLRKSNTSKVAVGDLNKIIESCDNKVGIEELESLTDDGVTHIIADVDSNGNVQDVEAIEAEQIESRVDRMINRTNEGIVVIS